MKRVHTAAAVAAGFIVVVAIVASSPVFAGATQPASGCDEAAVREAIVNSQAVASPDFEFQYLECAEGFGWAVITLPSIPAGDAATVLLRGSGTEIEVLDLGTSICTADAGIPADVAPQIAPPGVDPAGDCPPPVPMPVPGEPDFTG
jgi:hypothetical protein